jgi:hypothetical protein
VFLLSLGILLSCCLLWQRLWTERECQTNQLCLSYSSLILYSIDYQWFELRWNQKVSVLNRVQICSKVSLYVHRSEANMVTLAQFLMNFYPVSIVRYALDPPCQSLGPQNIFKFHPYTMLSTTVGWVSWLSVNILWVSSVCRYSLFTLHHLRCYWNCWHVTRGALERCLSTWFCSVCTSNKRTSWLGSIELGVTDGDLALRSRMGNHITHTCTKRTVDL